MATKEELIGNIVEAIRAYQRSNDTVDEIATDRFGLNRTDGRCVDILEESGPMTAGSLATLTGLTTGAITAAIDRLERAGLARRVRDAGDRRKVMVDLTEEARAICASFYGPLAARGARMMTRYSVAELGVI